MFDTAREFAAQRHGDQRYGDAPYVVHLDAVVEVARHFGFTDPVLLTAALLHDVVEDTATTIEEVRDLFGEEVAALVAAVTNEPGENRRARHAATYPKTRAAGHTAVALKLCDRIANVRACLQERDHKLRMYQKEHVNFRALLYRDDDGPRVEEAWMVLESLLFRHVL